MLVFKEKGKSMDISLDPQFLADLGMLVQIVFPKPTQSFMAKEDIICVLESNRKLMSIRNPFEGVFRGFNATCEALPEKYTADQTLFSVQPMTMDEYKKEQADKLAKAPKKKAAPVLAGEVEERLGFDEILAGRPVVGILDDWARDDNRFEALVPQPPAPRQAEAEAQLRQILDRQRVFATRYMPVDNNIQADPVRRG